MAQCRMERSQAGCPVCHGPVVSVPARPPAWHAVGPVQPAPVPVIGTLRPRGRARLLTAFLCCVSQIFPGLILSDIKPAKRMRFRTVCYLLVQLMHCRRVFKAEVPFSNVMTCEDDDKVRAAVPCSP